MRSEDSLDIQAGYNAMAADAAAVFCGIMLATWLRFDSGWFAVPFGEPAGLYFHYACGGGAAAAVFLVIFAALRLYVRPQIGSFSDKVPRLTRAAGMGMIFLTAMAFIVKNIFFSYSSGVLLISVFTVPALLLVERYALFMAEMSAASALPPNHRMLIVGTGAVANRIRKAIENEPRLRAQIAGFVRVVPDELDGSIPADMVTGSVNEFPTLLREGKIDQVILTDSRVEHDRLVEMILLCDRNMTQFKLVPDLFRVLTAGVDVQSLGDIPLIGIGRWPLDFFWNRAVKRAADIAGAIVGLVLASPVIAAAAVLIRRESPGSVFYRQERCGRNGVTFNLLKLRTMREDAEAASGPVWTAPEDPRRTKIGAVLRSRNLDELPQLWNVLKGEMSLVGPRPERPCFVEQFREDIVRYMWRHVSKPGMTGWAQVNGLRGNTSIAERIKYDLHYLENWSLAFDFKILIRTFFAKKNAY